MSQPAHPTDALQALADGQLDAVEREQAEQHLRDCASCRQTLEALGAVKRAIVRLPQIDLPQGFDARLAAALAAEDTAEGAGLSSGPVGASPTAERVGMPWRRWVAPLGIAAAIVLVAAFWWRSAPSLPGSAAAATADYDARRLVVASDEHEAAALQTYLAARVSFPVRVFDLGMMGYTLEGGRVHDVGGHPSALWVYRGTAGSLICQMYRGRTAELPAPTEAREANGFTFLIYHEQGGTQVFWQEGDVVCVLASSLPAEDVIQLAIAKAMKP